MWVLGVNTTHDASICLMRDGEVVLHLLEERLAHEKHAHEIVWCINKVKEYTNHLDILAVTSLWGSVQTYEYVKRLLHKDGVSVDNYFQFNDHHHILHASCGFHNSPFDEAVCVVLDGAGADIDNTTDYKENETIYEIKRVNNKLDYNVLYRSLLGSLEYVEKYNCNSKLSIGFVYAAITNYLGFNNGDEGKVMGLSSYGFKSSNVNDFVDPVFGGSGEYFKYINTPRIGVTSAEVIGNSLFKIPPSNSVKSNPEANFKIKANIAHRAQSHFEEYTLGLIKKALELSDLKNVVLTGGCFMNCVSNYKLLDHLPPDVNVWVDPICTDVGISLGAATAAADAIFRPENKTRAYPMYLGTKLNYEYTLTSNQTERNTSAKEVASLIRDGNIVAIAQGRAESGARALGNRSILYDPRDPNGKEKVNRVKKREPWRPFAGTVMLEYSRDWFDMKTLDESPFMTYAINVFPEKQKLIPSITHVDGTCRIQTVTSEQNKHYYDLISEFNNLTGVPILFNTSFNLAGDTIVETMQDALKTLEDSEIEYLYLPDIMKLIHVPNK